MSKTGCARTSSTSAPCPPTRALSAAYKSSRVGRPVVILSAPHLIQDLSSLRPVSSSHPYRASTNQAKVHRLSRPSHCPLQSPLATLFHIYPSRDGLPLEKRRNPTAW